MKDKKNKKNKKGKKNNELKLCKKCKIYYTSEENGICINCQATDWLRTK